MKMPLGDRFGPARTVLTKRTTGSKTITVGVRPGLASVKRSDGDSRSSPP